MQKIIFSLLLLFVLCKHTIAQSFQNGDLEGIINGFATLPDSWQNVPTGDPNCFAIGNNNDTPDLVSLTEPMVSGGYNCNPYSGLTCIIGGMAKNINPGGFVHEGIMQTVNGFVIGSKYSIIFHQTVVKPLGATDNSGSWAVFVDTLLAGVSIPTYSNEPISSINLNWEIRKFTFTATSTSHLIKFLPMDDDTNYIVPSSDTTGGLFMGIDSIGLEALIDGLDEDIYGEAFKVFPNPNNGVFTLQYDGVIKQPILLTITDVYGKQIDKIYIVNNFTNYKNTSLRNGLYFYNLQQGSIEIERGKIIIQK